jgi:hypothetical protein
VTTFRKFRAPSDEHLRRQERSAIDSSTLMTQKSQGSYYKHKLYSRLTIDTIQYTYCCSICAESESRPSRSLYLENNKDPLLLTSTRQHNVNRVISHSLHCGTFLLQCMAPYLLIMTVGVSSHQRLVPKGCPRKKLSVSLAPLDFKFALYNFSASHSTSHAKSSMLG